MVSCLPTRAFRSEIMNHDRVTLQRPGCVSSISKEDADPDTVPYHGAHSTHASPPHPALMHYHHLLCVARRLLRG